VCSSDMCLAQIHDVDVGAEARVVGQVVAGIIGIFVDDDVVRVPEPAVHEADVIGRDAPVPVVEPEAAGATAAEAPAMRGAKAAVPMAVLPGVVEVVMRVVGATIVTDPVVAVDMGHIGVARLVGVVAVFRLLWCGVFLWWCRMLWWCAVLLRHAVIRLGSARGRGVLLMPTAGRRPAFGVPSTGMLSVHRKRQNGCS